jgi:hypothetical protein
MKKVANGVLVACLQIASHDGHGAFGRHGPLILKCHELANGVGSDRQHFVRWLFAAVLLQDGDQVVSEGRVLWRWLDLVFTHLHLSFSGNRRYGLGTGVIVWKREPVVIGRFSNCDAGKARSFGDLPF